MKTTDQKLHDLIQSRATHIKHGKDNDLLHFEEIEEFMKDRPVLTHH